MTGSPLETAKRIVVKIGSTLLVDRETGLLREDWLRALAGDVADARARGQDILLVSSGAIALGRGPLKLRTGILRLEESQAAASVGQVRLAHAYQSVLGDRGLTAAQILLTLSDSEERRRYLNARATLEQLLSLGAVPVVNENDTIATNEIRYGDNDRLAARVAQMTSADCLVLLSDIDGLYTADPRTDPSARHVPEVPAITPEIEAMAGQVPRKTAYRMGSGGMVTKLLAAKIAVDAGTQMAIADGRDPAPLTRLRNGGRATWFLAAASPRTQRKQWIAGTLSPQGTLVVDAGAARALGRGNSLLPAGVKSVRGAFDRGDAVRIEDEAGQEIARGLVAYGSADAAALAGCQSPEIEERLGYKGRDEIVHRDDLALLGPGSPPAKDVT